MTKKLGEKTWHIKILNPEGKKKIDELIKLGLVKIDEDYIKIMEEKAELTREMSVINEKLEHYLRQKLFD